MVRKFIKGIKVKKGALSRQLDIPEEDNIPMTLLYAIIKAKVGTTIINPTKSGKKRIKVTRLLKRRATLARTFKRITKKRYR